MRYNRDSPEKDAAPAQKEEDGWQREVKRITEILDRRGIKADDVDADGNCLFRAMSRQCGLDELDHMNVRGRALRWMRSHPEDFAPYLTMEEKGPSDEVADEKVYRYTQSMNKAGSWGGDMEIKAMANLFKIVIMVHQADKDEPLEFGDCSDKNTECAQLIFYPTHHAGAHYDVGYFPCHMSEGLPTYGQAKGYLFEANQKEKERKLIEAEAQEKAKHDSRFVALGPKLAATKAKPKKKRSAFG